MQYLAIIIKEHLKPSLYGEKTTIQEPLFIKLKFHLPTQSITIMGSIITLPSNQFMFLYCDKNVITFAYMYAQ